MESIEGTASSPGPQGIAVAGPVGVDHSMALQPGPLASIEGTASSTGPQLQPVPAPVDHSMERQPGPLGSMVVHSFTPCLPTSAYVHPMFADVCILLDLESKVVHHAGPGIHGCASSTGPRGIHRGNCIESPPVGIAAAVPVGVDRSMESNQVP